MRARTTTVCFAQWPQSDVLANFDRRRQDVGQIPFNSSSRGMLDDSGLWDRNMQKDFGLSYLDNYRWKEDESFPLFSALGKSPIRRRVRWGGLIMVDSFRGLAYVFNCIHTDLDIN